jgi:hypothetical protein
LLGLLGAKTFGRSPDSLGGSIQGVIDVAKHFKANQLRYTSDFVAATVLGGSNGQSWPTTGSIGMLTPAGKVRIPIALGYLTTSPAASAIKWTATLVYNATTNSVVPIGSPMVVGASESPWQGILLPPDLVLLPGMGFGYQVASLTGAAVQVACSMLYAEFPGGG